MIFLFATTMSRLALEPIYPFVCWVLSSLELIPATERSILAKTLRCRYQLIQEAMKSKICANNMNREDGFSLSRSWKPSHPFPEGKTEEVLKGHTSHFLLNDIPLPRPSLGESRTVSPPSI
jgi:hypothetical protein